MVNKRNNYYSINHGEVHFFKNFNFFNEERKNRKKRKTGAQFGHLTNQLFLNIEHTEKLNKL